MSKERLDQLFNNAVRDTLIENLELREKELVEDLKLILRHYAGEEDEADTFPDDDDESNNDVQLDWDYSEDTEEWDGE